MEKLGTNHALRTDIAVRKRTEALNARHAARQGETSTGRQQDRPAGRAHEAGRPTRTPFDAMLIANASGLLRQGR